MQRKLTMMKGAFLLIGLLIAFNKGYAGGVVANWTLASTSGFPSTMLPGNTYTLPLILTNTDATRPLTITKLQLTDAPAGLALPGDNNCDNTVLTPGQSCSFNATYVPQAPGRFTLQIQLASFGYVWKKTNQSIYLNVASPNVVTALSSTTTAVALSPSQTLRIMVHNDGAAVTANDVTIVPPPEFNGSFIPGNCSQIAPGEGCELVITTTESLPPNLSGVFTIEGRNTTPLTVHYTTDASADSSVVAQSLNFAQPGMGNLVVLNQGSTPISISSLSLGAGISGVSGGTIPPECTNLNPGASCSIPFSATQDAYGSAVATIQYQTQGDATAHTAVTTVSVADTTLAINSGETIEVGSTQGVFGVYNTGKFNWHNPVITADTNDSWLGLTYNCQDVLPENACSVSYTINQTIVNDGGSVITATGTNAITTTENFLPPALSIAIDGEPNDQHLEYRAVRVSNLSANSQTLQSVSSNISNAGLEFCDATASNCENNPHYATTCTTNLTLARDSSCLLWYRVLPSVPIETPQTATLWITLSVNGSNISIDKFITATYKNNLYVGGSFSSAGAGTTSISTNGIAAWSGNTWSALENGMGTSTVKALALFDGDLYAGGAFANMGGVTVSNVARWNGTAWEGLAAGVSGGTVPSVNTLLGSDTDHALYVGGSFDTAGSITVGSIARWTDTGWASLSTGVAAVQSSITSVNALARMGNCLYVGGFFSVVSHASLSTPGSYLACWNVANSSWSNVDGPDSVVKALAVFPNSTGGDALYVGGDFTTVASMSNTGHIASYDGSSWAAVGQGVDGSVNALAPAYGGLYLGGLFNSVFSNESANTAEKIARWLSTTSTWDTSADLSSVATSWITSVDAFATMGNTLYVGGYFSNAESLYNIALWDNDLQQWTTPMNLQVGGPVSALLIAPSLSLSASN